MADSESFRSVKELGEWARAARKSRGITLESLSREAGVGIRFLSEFERGKETAELGKVLQALGGIGLGLAPVGGGVRPAPVPGDAPKGSGRLGPRPSGTGDQARLWDMLSAAIEIQDLVVSGMTGAGAVPAGVRKRALERCFDILGEAARRVTPIAQARHPRIPWRELIGRRNALVLEYHQDHLTGLMTAARDELPGLIRGLQDALGATGS